MSLKIPLTEISNLFKHQYLVEVRRIGNKQLFLVVVEDGNDIVKFLVSYRTVVGVNFDRTWFIFDKTYSQTTKKHITIFTRHTILPVMRVTRPYNGILSDILNKYLISQ